MTYKFLGFLVGSLMLVSAGPASAAKVSVEIEGQNVVKAPTLVDTPASVANHGQTCASGTSVLGALDVVTAGDWQGVKYGLDAPDTILGELHSFDENNGNWVFVVNGKTANDTACNTPVADGDKVLWFWSSGVAPYKADAGFDDPVLLTAPSTATPGVAFTVTVRDTLTSYDGNGAGSTAITPSQGTTITGGSATATTGADGTAQVTVPAGPYTLIAKKANSAPARVVGCATNGSDGQCGTTLATPAATSQATPAPDKTAALSRVTGIAEGKKYAKGKGPRQLTGRTDADQSGVADIRLRLTRTDGRKCSTYDGKTEKFKTIKKCGATHGTWFSVGAKAEWSYLLPSKLGKGRYVLDVEVTDKAGNKTAQLARGTSRVVFTVA